MSDEATPRPWVYELDTADDGDISVFRDGPPGDGIPGRPVCAIDVRVGPEQAEMPSREEALANAGLIVRAVNAHEALVEALRLAICEMCGYMYGSPKPGYVCSCEKARAALKLAEEAH